MLTPRRAGTPTLASAFPTAAAAIGLNLRLPAGLVLELPLLRHGLNVPDFAWKFGLLVVFMDTGSISRIDEGTMKRHGGGDG